MHLKSITFHPDTYPTKTRYPFNLDVFLHGVGITFEAPVTLFVGENGAGKSTLLEAIAHRCVIHIWRREEGSRYEHNPYEDRFCDYITVEWTNGRVPGSFFGGDIFRHFAQALDEWAVSDPGQLEYFGGKSLLTQSHGQSLMSFFRNRYQVRGLYLLDEPETALSPRSQLELLEILEKMGEAGHAQFIVATHSPILLGCPGAVILSFDQAPIRRVAYEETEHFQVYRDFLIKRGS